MLATPLETATLPPGIRSRFVRGVNGLDIHILEVGYAPADRPLVLLLHGFPEIAYSWRKVMPALAEAGLTRSHPTARLWPHNRLSPDSIPICGRGARSRRARRAWPRRGVGHRSIHAVVGNDFGARIAAWVRWFGPTCSARWRL